MEIDNAPAFHPLDYLSVLRRRVWWLVVPIVLAVIVAAGLYVYLPRQYKSTVTFGVSLLTGLTRRGITIILAAPNPVELHRIAARIIHIVDGRVMTVTPAPAARVAERFG